MKPTALTSLIVLVSAVTVVPTDAVAQSFFPLIKPEQRQIQYRDPSGLPSVYVPDTAAPPTVDNPNDDFPERYMSLDEAIQIALQHSEVVRVLGGDLATATGQTIYDPAITNTTIDAARAGFDPNLIVNNTWGQTEPPVAFFGPDRTEFRSTKTQSHQLGVDLSQSNMLGGTAQYSFDNAWSKFYPGIFPLNPQNRYTNEVSYTQPLLAGAGIEANRVPIVLARINTERSYFQFTNSIQNLTRSVIAGYWSLVFARTDEWARRIQLEQSVEAFNQAKARFKFEFADIREVAQTRSSLARFNANLISAKANVLQRESALQNVLGLSPTESVKLIPVTPPTMEKIEFDWNELNRIAGVRRPDLIELKLVLEADNQRLLLAKNIARPNLDAFALYRWNGLEGEMPNGQTASTNSDQFTDWTLGVNFSVPLLLRQERANLRSAELVIARDRANLQQGYHSARHRLALNFRNLDQFYAQYLAFKEFRAAAKANLERQAAAEKTGTIIFLNVLEAINDWGNSVSSEASSLAQYNTELANLEFETGTILETHGVFMFEDRYCSLGPLHCLKKEKLYPRDIHPGNNAPRYPEGDEPAEKFFNLDDYPRRIPKTEPYDPSLLELPPLPESIRGDDIDNSGNDDRGPDNPDNNSDAPSASRSLMKMIGLGRFINRE